MLNATKQLCKLIFNFLNIDIIFVDSKSNIKSDYRFTRIPKPLQPYFSDIIYNLNLYDSNKDIVLFHSNSYRLNFISAKIIDEGNYLGSIIVGPYLLDEPTILMIESVILENKMAISLKDILKQYYLSIPMISLHKSGLTAEIISYLVSSLHPHCFDNLRIGSSNYDIKTKYFVPSNIIRENTEHTIESLQKKYNVENEIMHAVETGNKELFGEIIGENKNLITNIPYRIPSNPLRSLKNYCIVLNTLLRKAAEKGGLHPIYLNSISSKYAVQIEKCISIHQLRSLTANMEMEYCDAVGKLSLKNYTNPVRKAIEFIRINLDQDLNLDSISSALYISPFELSRQFKKETGGSIVEFINKKRINEAIYLLENKYISITDISCIVGFNDANYFTKIFKKVTGVTPSEYRKKTSGN